MENMGRKAAILAAAVATVGALGAGYYYRNDIIYKICDIVHPEWNEGEARLTDDLDRRCSLLNNGDGTETVLYDNDTAVTFRRDEGGDLVWLYGTASMIAPLAANYFAFHGFSYPGGHMELAQMTYRIDGALTPLPEAIPVRSGRHHHTTVINSGGGRGGNSDNDNYERNKSRRIKDISKQSGFGRAGIRSSSGAS